MIFYFRSSGGFMDIGWIMGGFFAILTVAYIAIAILAPELVGIQGKAAKKVEESHRQASGQKPLDDESQKS
jgi:hypothetical protein